MAASNTRFTQNSLGQSKNPIDSDHGIYRYSGAGSSSRCSAARPQRGHSRRGRSACAASAYSSSLLPTMPMLKLGWQRFGRDCSNSAGSRAVTCRSTLAGVLEMRPPLEGQRPNWPRLCQTSL